MKTLTWLKSMKLPGGGIACWPGGESYPEVTGYCIPTLLDYGEAALAGELADWLLSIQASDGSFSDIAGAPRNFDTAACVEGLERAYEDLGQAIYLSAATRARKWLATQKLPSGALRTTPLHDKTHLYTMRASGILGDRKAAEHWKSADWGEPLRAHYAAYALEGLWLAGERDYIVNILRFSRRVITQSGLMPYWITGDWRGREGTDACATAQFGVLYRWAGMDAGPLLEGLAKVLRPDGSLLHGLSESVRSTWAAKFYLDLMRLL